MENFPFFDALFALATHPVVLFDSELPNTPYSNYDCRSVRQENVHDKMVPPALTEMRHDMLPCQFHNLCQYAPQPYNGYISQDKGGEEKVYPVDNVVMIHLIPDLWNQSGPRKIAIIIISMHFFCYWLVKIRVQKAEEFSAIHRALENISDARILTWCRRKIMKHIYRSAKHTTTL